MNQTLHEFCLLFWVCLGASAFYAVLSYLVIWRRPLWLRFIDAEVAFWKRVRLPWLSFDRRFGASRFFTISMVFFAVTLLLLAVVCAILYFHFRAKIA
jgi:hypothetical protein